MLAIELAPFFGVAFHTFTHLYTFRKLFRLVVISVPGHAALFATFKNETHSFPDFISNTGHIDGNNVINGSRGFNFETEALPLFSVCTLDLRFHYVDSLNKPGGVNFCALDRGGIGVLRQPKKLFPVLPFYAHSPNVLIFSVYL